MDALLLGIRRRRPVQLLQQIRALSGRQDIQLAHRRVRRLLQRVGQLLERALHVAADPIRGDGLRHLRRQTERLANIIHRQGQRIVGAFLPAQPFHAAQPSIRSASERRRGVAVVQQRAEQRRRRRNAAAALRQRQRGLLVRQQLGQPGVRGPHARLDPGAVQIKPQRQGVDEQAHGAVGTRAAMHAAKQHRAEHHLLAAAAARHHLSPRQMTQAGQAHPKPPRLAAQSRVERLRQPPMRLMNPAAVAVDLA